VIHQQHIQMYSRRAKQPAHPLRAVIYEASAPGHADAFHGAFISFGQSRHYLPIAEREVVSFNAGPLWVPAFKNA
jgi:hypothetical protein